MINRVLEIQYRAIFAAVLLVNLLLLLLPLSLRAETAKSVIDYSTEDQEIIRRVEGYINDLTTLKASFVQSNPNGTFDSGFLLLKRPGQMRVDYDDPNPLLLIATGTLFIYVDRKLKEVTHLPLSSSPASALLKKPFNLADNDDIEVIDIITKNNNIKITLREADEPEKGQLSLIFSDNPLTLRQWEVVDEQEFTTRLSLVDTIFGPEIEDQWFRFRNPWNRNNSDN